MLLLVGTKKKIFGLDEEDLLVLSRPDMKLYEIWGYQFIYNRRLFRKSFEFLLWFLFKKYLEFAKLWGLKTKIHNTNQPKTGLLVLNYSFSFVSVVFWWWVFSGFPPYVWDCVESFHTYSRSELLFGRPFLPYVSLRYYVLPFVEQLLVSL